MPETRGKRHFPLKAAQNPAHFPQIRTRFDTDLQALIDAWPKLPANVKASILSMIPSGGPTCPRR